MAMGSDCKASSRKTTSSSSSPWRSLFDGCIGAIRATTDKVRGSGMLGQPPDQLDTSSVTPVAFSSDLHVFTIPELHAATEGFASGNLLGEGGLGKVYRGFLQDGVRPGLPAQPVVVKVSRNIDSYGEILLKEAMFLAQLQQRHPRLVKMIGYCYEGQHRLLVYEFMGHGSLDDYLSKRTPSVLPWPTRLSIVIAIAKALASLHGEKKPLICGNFGASNVMLDSDNNAKLLDLMLITDDRNIIRFNCMGTATGSRSRSRRCVAPEYFMHAPLTTKIDVYNFGVMLLEVLITGLNSMNISRSIEERNLVKYAWTSLNDPVELARIMDPTLNGIYPVEASQKVALLAYTCLHVKPKKRPNMSVVVEALELLTSVDAKGGIQ